MSVETNKLVSKVGRFGAPAGAAVALVLAATLFFHHNGVHAAMISSPAPMDDNSVSALVSLDQAVEAVAARVSEFVGVIPQVPPAYSAAKVTGRRAYDLARRGEKVTLSARPVSIHAVAVLHYVYPHLELEVHCGKGTYIRSLARDLGERLGCGALVQTLRRTRVGPFGMDAALALDTDAETAHSHLLPVELAVAELPRLVLPEKDWKRLRHGQSIAVAEEPEWAAKTCEAAVFDTENRLIAVAMLDPNLKSLRPVKVLRS